MYTYTQTEHGLWTVGFYDPQGKWHAESDHDSAEKAAERVHYLNGGEMYAAEPEVSGRGKDDKMILRK